jgi:hypothetical protein
MVAEGTKRINGKYAEYIAKKMAGLPSRRITENFPRTREEWLAHSVELRKNLREVFHFPTEKCPLNARIVGAIDLDDMRIEKLIYDSAPGSAVVANVYVPKGVKFPVPAIICPSGHGGSKSTTYNQYFGQILAKGGIICLIPEPLGEVERGYGGGHDSLAAHSWKYGQSTIGKMVYDIVLVLDSVCSKYPGTLNDSDMLIGGSCVARNIEHVLESVDCLTTRSEVDPDRIACVGEVDDIAMFAAAIDERIAGTEVRSRGTGRGEPPNVSMCAGRAALLSLIAPRKLTLKTTENEKDIGNVKRVYELYGAAACFLEME